MKELTTQQRDIVSQALQIMESRVEYMNPINSPQEMKDYLRLKYAGEEHEIFSVTLLDTKHRVIGHFPMFAGTLSQTSIYPREVVKLALRHNAAAMILSHNHPSGLADPSSHDIRLTDILKTALALVDVRVLDHVIVATGGTVSLAEKGLV